MRKLKQIALFMPLLVCFIYGCSNKKGDVAVMPFDPSQPIEVTSFFPDSGGIATQMIINGNNFGTDTTGLRVYFVDSLGVRHPGGVVSSNGNKIYLAVPKLTYLTSLDIVVERTDANGNVYSGTIENSPFKYKTQIAVATIIGQATDQHEIPTVQGSFTSCKLSSPTFLTLDDEDNLFITERTLEVGPWARNANGLVDHGGYAGNILLADSKKEEVIVLKYLNWEPLNAPTFNDDPGNEAIYLPEDEMGGYLQLRKAANYTIKKSSMLFTEEGDPFKSQRNWKHCLAANKQDKMLYTIMYRGELIRINPRTRQSEVLIKNVLPERNNIKGERGSDNFYVFSPIEPMVMYVVLRHYNMVRRIDLTKITPDGDYTGEDYAGLSITEGPQAGKGWEDGPLKMAKFDTPWQLAFTADGKLYIADSGNHCVRVIDTTVSPDQAVVNTAVGVPGSPGFRDGGPDQALFNYPSGVAVNSDGSELYVADHKNHVIRKLAIQ
ncbi:MAG: IPT/TIG domain-containing protein [Porphyromonas sp.]|nr:IPT/TIG domain-containing protein [Porphyromonas sp.]